jgi:hypothetical protein
MLRYVNINFHLYYEEYEEKKQRRRKVRFIGKSNCLIYSICEKIVLRNFDKRIEY